MSNENEVAAAAKTTAPAKKWLLSQLHLLEEDDHPGMIKGKEMQVRKLKVIPPQRGMTRTDLVRRQHQGSTTR